MQLALCLRARLLSARFSDKLDGNRLIFSSFLKSMAAGSSESSQALQVQRSWQAAAAGSTGTVSMEPNWQDAPLARYVRSHCLPCALAPTDTRQLTPSQPVIPWHHPVKLLCMPADQLSPQHLQPLAAFLAVAASMHTYGSHCDLGNP